MIHEIFSRHGSDKPTIYMPTYQRIVVPIRDIARAILEIGIHQGASLRAWAEIFPSAHIYGLDIRVPDIDLGERVTMIEGSQDDVATLQRLRGLATYDLIIDDGSHHPAHWYASYRALWPSVVRGGWYVIEDIQAPRHPGWPRGEIARMQDRVRDVLAPVIEQADDTDIDWIEAHQHIIAIRKR